MGKEVKKRAKETIKINNSEDKESDKTTNERDELNERLRRLEELQIARNNSHSDVVKFTFFFVMGIALTILVYPKISSTFNTDNSAIVTTKDDASERLLENVEKKLVTIDNLKKDKQTVPNDNVGLTLRENDTGFKDESLVVVAKTLNKTTDSSKQRHDNSINSVEQTSKATFEERQTDKPDTNENDIVKNKETYDKNVRERPEDLMIGEEDETITVDEHEPNENKQDVKEVIKELPMNLKINDDGNVVGERVQLFPAHIEDDIDDARVTKDAPVKNTKNKPVHSAANKSIHTKKTKKAKTGMNKVTTNDNKLTANKQNVPEEVKNFKATYQKEIAPKKIFADGRRIPAMELLPQKPNNSSVKVWLYEEFLSEEECDGLMRVHNKHITEQTADDPLLCFDSISTLRKHLKHHGIRTPVSPRDFTEGTTCVNASFSSQLKDWFKGNWSYSTAFYPGESRFASIFEQRVLQATGLEPANGGKFQITSYPEGIGYKSHTDCTEGLTDQRDRIATILVYLDTVEEGGETDFTELGIWARPRKGRALLWNNMDPDGKCEPLSVHKANKVLKGHKYILQRWYYYKSFYSLGKRPPEPPLPARQPGQSRVSCDEYEHGSCRWYDEWNFEHLIEYERQKYTLV
ncbi:uncharacterized protein LOC128237063 [Mya arenaria]|uniref:uncharacterized protein LOC128237063 n=1 Tax=Mya arenaria TaxID=6604 RepID=UPI0022E1ABE1|nr:uncharacterized protein LOC128237063 [Mya arenaria]